VRVERGFGEGEVGRERNFVIRLNRGDVDKLYGMDSIHGADDKGVGFWLYSRLSSPHPQESFVPMPVDVDPQGYFYTIGSSEARSPEELARMLQRRGRIPIELPSRKGRKPVNVGFVTFDSVAIKVSSLSMAVA
jgi:hypothetical protein